MFDNFEITIAAVEAPTTGTNVTVRYAGGVRMGGFSLAAIAETVAELNSILQQIRPSRVVLEACGCRLFEALFTGRILDAFRESLTLARVRHQGLRIRLFSELPAVISIPWEYLCDQQQVGWLALHPDISFVRALPLQVSEPLPVEGLLRVLVVLSSPIDLPTLNSTVEWENLQNATAIAPVELIRSEPTYTALLTTLRQSPQVLHFVGHGAFDDASKQGCLVFVNEHGEADLIAADKLATLLGGCKSLRLVILNSCEGAVAREYNAFAGIAQQLIQHQIPAVLAMQMPIADADAISFSEELYRALAGGLSLEQAVGEGRKRINEVTCNWGVPALYFQGTEPFAFPLLSNEERADRLWQKASQINNGLQFRNTLSTILTLHPKHDGARRALEKLDNDLVAARIYTAAETDYQNQRWRETYHALEQIERLSPNFRNTRSWLAEVLGKLSQQPMLSVSDSSHMPQYELILNALKEGRLVPFLGWDVSRFGRPAQDSWVKGRYPPSANELARILAEPLHGEVEGAPSLLQVSQYVTLLEGESVLYERLYTLYDAEYPLTMLHCLLAELPRRLREKGYPTNQNRRFVIFSTMFDNLIERAFIQTGQPYHLFAYRHQAADVNGVVRPSRFVHIPPTGETIELLTPSTYTGHDIDHYPILVKLCGQHISAEPENNVAITEDQYLDYLPAQEIGALLPLTLLNQIKRRSFLLFGYSLQPWHFRLLWQRLKFQKSSLHEKAWAIASDMTVIEQAFWRHQGVQPLITSPESVVAYINKWLDTL